MKQKYKFRLENMTFLIWDPKKYPIWSSWFNHTLYRDKGHFGRKGEEMVQLNLEALRKGKEITDGKS